jgi:DNA end-binding protein Ku
MVAIAETIIKRRSGHFDPATFRDRCQEARRGLIEAKMKGLPVKPKEIATPAAVPDLMSVLKRSLAQEIGAAAKPTQGGRR